MTVAINKFRMNHLLDKSVTINHLLFNSHMSPSLIRLVFTVNGDYNILDIIISRKRVLLQNAQPRGKQTFLEAAKARFRINLEYNLLLMLSTI